MELLEVAKQWVSLTEKINAGIATYGDSLRLDKIEDHGPAIAAALLDATRVLRRLMQFAPDYVREYGPSRGSNEMEIINDARAVLDKLPES